jgi:predicted nucleic acid-binding protein
MSPVLVDSCVWITAARQQTDNLLVKLALEALLNEYVACWCGPVKLEVLGAARKEYRKRMALFFEVIPYLPWDESMWDEAKTLSWQLRDNGHSMPWNDLLIAVIARRHNAWIYTIDKSFELMSPYTGVRLYRPAYGGMFNPDYA